jgi:hypothetical protein
MIKEKKTKKILALSNLKNKKACSGENTMGVDKQTFDQ